MDKIMRRQPRLQALIYIFLFLTFSCRVSALTIWGDSETQNNSFMGDLFNLAPPKSTTGRGLPVLKTAEQARSALKIIETNFRQTGDLIIIAKLAPRIMALLPRNQNIRYLYVLALTARGELSKAQSVSANLTASKGAYFYSLLAKAAIARANKQFTEAINATRQAIAIEPDHPYAYNFLGQLEAQQGNNSQALKNFKMAIRRSPKFAAAHSNLGALYFLLGKPAQAWKAFSNAVAISPEYCAPLIGRAAISITRADINNAITDLKRCLQSNPAQLLARQRLAALYIKSGRLNQAKNLARTTTAAETRFSKIMLADIYLRQNEVAAARKQLKGLKKSAQVDYMLSLCDIIDGQIEDARKKIGEAIKLEPDSSALALVNIIYTFYKDGSADQKQLMKLGKNDSIGPLVNFVAGNQQAARNNFRAAYKFWTQAENLLPGFIFRGLNSNQVREGSSSEEQRFLALGMLFYLKGLYPAALLEFEKALKTKPSSFMANYFAALASARAGYENKVNKYLLRSLKQTPYFFPANYMMAERSLRHRDINKAIRYYRAAARSEPDAGVLVKLALLYESKGEIKQARETYQRLIDAHPENFLGYNQLAWLYAKRAEHLGDALALARQADKLVPGNASVNDTLGWIYFHMGKYNLANTYLRQANKISNNNNPDILFHLASVSYRKGNLQTAKNQLQKAMALSKNFGSIKEAKELLKKLP
ncbi:MAG TPA: tetratricopeptide repeat protein [Gammaproteobacteria bacterium]|nr:tetratricopeptide repeat protein [Gammaproteobacteria bacterium]